MKAIILAAGMGTRLGVYTKELPKCLLPFCGKPLLQWQIETLRASGVSEIAVVRGYQSAAIGFDDIQYFENSDFSTTNMLESLLAARTFFEDSDDDLLVCYSDILYERRLVDQLLNVQTKGISVLADDAWLEYWKARSDDWKDDVESFCFNENDQITEIGEPRCSLNSAQSRYVGLIKFSPEVANNFCGVYDELRASLWSHQEKWRFSPSFRKAYFTCMLQEVISRNFDVRVVHVENGWLEFDTEEDYQKANTWHKNGSLERFISLQGTGEGGASCE